MRLSVRKFPRSSIYKKSLRFTFMFSSWVLFPTNLNCQSRLAPGDKFRNIAHATIFKLRWKTANIFHCLPIWRWCAVNFRSPSHSYPYHLFSMVKLKDIPCGVENSKKFEILSRYMYIYGFSSGKNDTLYISFTWTCVIFYAFRLSTKGFLSVSTPFLKARIACQKLYAFSVVESTMSTQHDWKIKEGTGSRQLPGFSLHTTCASTTWKLSIRSIWMNKCSKTVECETVRSLIATIFWCFVLRICIIPANT